MKQKLLRLGKFFFLSTAMLLMSCQNDEPALSTHEGHAHADRNKISMAQFRNETLIKHFKALAQVPVAQNSITGKNTAPEDFAIDTLAIKKHIDETGSITYSFRIYPLEADADPSKKFNLVYMKEDNVWQTSILSFKANENPSDQNQALYSDLENLYDSRIGGGSNICVTETWSVQCDGSCHGSCDGFNCPTGQCLQRSVSVFSCPSGGGGDTGGGGSPNPGSPVTPGGGGNVPVNPYQFTPNILENPIFDSPEYLRAYRAQSFWEIMVLMNAQGWASQNSSIYLDILNSLLDNYNIENIEFAKWSINYLRLHPNATIEQFQNWFMVPREGKDFDYDASFWENPNLTFEHQDLPSWSDFDGAYPRSQGAALVQLIGGPVQNAYNQYPALTRGYCALKLSRGLNYAGITIPQITTTAGNPGTVLGGDGKYYFLNAKALNKWMRETFGTFPDNSSHYNFLGSDGGTNGENFPTLVSGLKGIYSMVSTDSNWASGHADLINEGECVFGCHFYDTPPAPIDYIDIWILE